MAIPGMTVRTPAERVLGGLLHGHESIVALTEVACGDPNRDVTLMRLSEEFEASAISDFVIDLRDAIGGAVALAEFDCDLPASEVGVVHDGDWR